MQSMELIEKYKWLLVIVGAVLILGGLLSINSSTETLNTDKKSDDKMMSEDKDKKNGDKMDAGKKMTGDEKMTPDQAKKSANTYTAKMGGSYTKMARDVVMAYNEATDSGLSRAQIVAAETFLTQDAGAPLLEVGQVVKFDGKVVGAAVEKAQALNAHEVAAWQVYVPYVDFDTSHVN